MTWLEDPWPAIITGVVVDIALAIMLFKSGRGMWLYVMAAVLAATIGMVALESLVVTESERIEEALYSAAAAAERNDVPGVLKHVAPSAATARSRLEAELPRYRFSEASIAGDLEIRIDPSLPDIARAEFTGRCRVSDRGANLTITYIGRMTVMLQREVIVEGDGRWLITNYEHRPLLGRQ